MSSEHLLEIINGATILPGLILLLVLTRYLGREARRRGLRWYDWIHLPPSMDLVLAMLVCDVGLSVRSIITWGWRFFGAGDFNAAQAAGLVAGGLLIALGLLCKTRALTRPDYGDLPWFMAAGATVATTALLVYLGGP